MRNIIIISSFDPITNKMVEDILKFNDNETKFILIPTYSKYASIDDRAYMINIALKELNINYELNLILSKKYKETIDLSKLLNAIPFNEKDDIFVLFCDEKTVIVDKNKIKTYKIKLDLNNLNYDKSREVRVLKNIDINEKTLDFIIRKNLYFMQIITRYISGHRLEHSISVAKLSYKIALANDLPKPDDYFIAGLLHDLGKKISDEESLNYMEKYYRYYVNLPTYAYHQFIGAFLSKILFPNTSGDVYKAILFHCTGNANMSDIQKVIYAADKIEPTRGYDSKSLIDACLKDFNQGFIEVLKENMKFLKENSGDPSRNSLTKRCLECYIEE